MRLQSLGWEDPLEKGMATHSSILAQRIPWTGTWWATVHRVAQNWTRLKRLGTTVLVLVGFPVGSYGKESSCNVGDLGLIPGLGRSPGEGNGYPLQCSGLGFRCTTVIQFIYIFSGYFPI